MRERRGRARAEQGVRAKRGLRQATKRALRCAGGAYALRAKTGAPRPAARRPNHRAPPSYMQLSFTLLSLIINFHGSGPSPRRLPDAPPRRSGFAVRKRRAALLVWKVRREQRRPHPAFVRLLRRPFLRKPPLRSRRRVGGVRTHQWVSLHFQKRKPNQSAWACAAQARRRRRCAPEGALLRCSVFCSIARVA